MLVNKFCNFCAFFSYFGVKNRHFSTNFKSNFVAQNAGNGTCGLQISKIFWGGMPPNPPRWRVAFGPACSFHPKCYGQIETLNPPLIPVRLRSKLINEKHVYYSASAWFFHTVFGMLGLRHSKRLRSWVRFSLTPHVKSESTLWRKSWVFSGCSGFLPQGKLTAGWVKHS